MPVPPPPWRGAPPRAARVALLIAPVLAALSAPRGAAADDDHPRGAIVFARGASLYRADARGRGAAPLAELPGGKASAVRALRSDAAGKVLLVDVGGAWSWLRLDGDDHALRPLPCAEGPAQLGDDGACVLCRAPRGGGSLIVDLASGRATAVAVPVDGARLVGAGAARRLVWADKEAIWAAPPGDLAARAKVAPEPPLRSLLISPDGRRGVGVYDGEVFEGRARRPAPLLFGFALDGVAARRKAIKGGVPVAWSHDGAWVLVQDGASACLMRATGGQYKCWKGYTATSLSPDGAYALVLGSRDRGAEQDAGKGGKPGAGGKGGKGGKVGAAGKAGPGGPGGKGRTPGAPDQRGDAPAARGAGKPGAAATADAARPPTASTPPTPPRSTAPAGATPAVDGEPADDGEGEPEGGEPGEAPDGEPAEDGDAAGPADVAVALPSGPLALYRARLAGAFTDPPVLVERDVEGAAAWIP